MKRKTIVLIIISIITISTAIAAIKTTEEIEPIPSATVTIGDTRVTLVNIARTVTLSNQYVHGNIDKKGQVYAVPGVYVDFLIERLGNTPTKMKRTGGIEFWENGNKISDLGSVVSGGVGGTKQYQPDENKFGFDMPSPDNPDRAYIRYSSRRGIVFTSKRIEVRMQYGFDDNEPQWFVFKNIPIY